MLLNCCILIPSMFHHGKKAFAADMVLSNNISKLINSVLIVCMSVSFSV